MDYQVKVLRAGYSRAAGPAQQRADGTITLVKGAQNIVVDTGGPWDRQVILSALQAEGLEPHDVDVVVCTHGHSDHVGNLNLFPDALLIVSHDICRRDLYTAHGFAQGHPYRIDDAVEVIATPGHTEEDVSVVVRTAGGTYVVAGDLFECAEDLADEALWRSSSNHPAEQERSRRMVLELADYVVPGHGDLFPVTPPESGIPTPAA
jgi:glyoxylase-like metal-dependent hydrolase (beta-lactamase superfamily II)